MTKQYFVRKRYDTLHYSTVSERYDTLHVLYCTNPASSAEEEDPFAPALLSDPPAARVHAPAHRPKPKPKPARVPRYKSAAVVGLLRKKRREEAAKARTARAQKRQQHQEESDSEWEPEDEPMSPEVQANSADSA